MTPQAPQLTTEPGTLPHALTFDIEDYFQVSNFDSIVEFREWDTFESRVERNTEKILEIISDHGVLATFFVLGWVAEKYPGLVRQITEQGHEVATHSYRHRLVYELGPEGFREDLRRSIGVIEDACGQKVVGHRAPSFSITKDSLWALDVLQEEGLKYDSSIFPIRHPRYGIPDAPRGPHEIKPGFWEFPMSTVRVGGLNFPVAGGGYFRLYPLRVTKWAMRLRSQSRLPSVIYLHPWEFDPDQPRLSASLQARFRHYINLARTEKRLRELCRTESFAPLASWLGA